MDFAYTPQQEALRREVLQFIRENVTEDVIDEIEHQSHPRGGGPLVNELFKKIHARGWLGIAYPKEYGGQGLGRMENVESAWDRMALLRRIADIYLEKLARSDMAFIVLCRALREDPRDESLLSEGRRHSFGGSRAA